MARLADTGHARLPDRNVMIHLAQAGIYRAKWTNDIHDEWMPHLMEKYQNVRVEDAQQIRGLIDASVPVCLVCGTNE
jgi:hypothetical protein